MALDVALRAGARPWDILVRMGAWLSIPFAGAFVLLALARRLGFVALWAGLAAFWLFLAFASDSWRWPLGKASYRRPILRAVRTSACARVGLGANTAHPERLRLPARVARHGENQWPPNVKRAAALSAARSTLFRHTSSRPPLAAAVPLAGATCSDACNSRSGYSGRPCRANGREPCWRASSDGTDRQRSA